MSDSTNLDRARDELDKISINFGVVDEHIRIFSFLLAIAEESIAEIALGILVRGIMRYEPNKVNNEVLWLLLAAVLSRSNIKPTSALRISLLGIVSRIENWGSPIFALLATALDSFLRNSLEYGDPLIAEQTVDFLATWGENYAQAPRTLEQVAKVNSLARSVLEKVDEPILLEEWSEGLDSFFNIASKTKYSDQRIWSSSIELLKILYPINILNNDEYSDRHRQVQKNILKLIDSSLAAIGTIFVRRGLSVVVHIEHLNQEITWSLGASAIDRIERFFQEVSSIFKLGFPKFNQIQSIQGSWIQVLNLPITSREADILATEIASLSSKNHRQSEINQNTIDSWRECAEVLSEKDFKINLSVSTKDIELQIIPPISTENFANISTGATTDSNEQERTHIRILSCDVPQANNIERILELSQLFVQYPSSAQTIRDKFLEIRGTKTRDFSYYRRAIEILNLIDWRGHPTNVCSALSRLSKKETKMRLLAYQFISSNVGSAWLLWKNANDLSEINPDSAEQFLTATCPSLSQKTIERRSQTLKAWLTVFLQYWDS
ncbi:MULTISPECIES: hypothetical protein [unclassified Synechocystis]|uniref:hypothetical protein n=1 Tax=unclassified Synechocystis TaxID=2640012 RepID=UPI001EE63A2C|nr:MULTISPECIES: hypothetical protein [unclassified Synechocystis]